MLKKIRDTRNEEGFTLIELLVVIIVLGILAAIVVFAVNGISDRGQAAACKTDRKTLQTAEEAYYAKNSTYGNETALKTGGFISDLSSLYNATVGSSSNSEGASETGSTYSVASQTSACSGI